MQSAHSIVHFIMVLAICCKMSGFSLAHHPATKQDVDPYEILGNIKLDPVILSTLKFNLDDNLLKRLQRGRCLERAIYLTKLQILIEIDKYNLLDIPGHVRLLRELPENLMELMVKPEDQAKCHELRVASSKLLEQLVTKRCEAGKATSESLNFVKAARMTAEIDYLKFKERLQKSPN